MTSPQPIDTGNHLLAETPTQIVTTLLDTADGQRLAMTVRTPSTTLTVLLNGPDAKACAEQITRGAAAMSGSGLVVAGGMQRPPIREC